MKRATKRTLGTPGARFFSFAVSWATVALLLGLLVSGLWASAALAATKTLTGKLRAVDDKVLTIEEKKLLDTSVVEVEMDSQTKVTGELSPGLMIKVTYREEARSEEKGSSAAAPTPPAPDDKAAGKSEAKEDAVRRIATKVKTWPEYSSRRDRKAAPVTQP
jgi:hypothetical protein